MSYASLVQNAIATARAITLDLHVDVQWKAWTGQNTKGKPDYADPVTLKALVEKKQKLVKTLDGQMKMSVAYIAILQEVTPNGATGRTEPIDLQDKFILPDGTSGTILSVSGFFDGGTGVPFYSEVYLG